MKSKSLFVLLLILFFCSIPAFAENVPMASIRIDYESKNGQSWDLLSEKEQRLFIRQFLAQKRAVEQEEAARKKVKELEKRERERIREDAEDAKKTRRRERALKKAQEKKLYTEQRRRNKKQRMDALQRLRRAATRRNKNK